jgi:hypothetical protein
VAPYGHHEEEYDHQAPAEYSFKYEVKDEHTKDIKSHHETRKGDHTSGAYSLLEPDGTTRLVEYVVDGHSGFQAVVHRQHTFHPPPQYHHQAIPVQHHQPIPVQPLSIPLHLQPIAVYDHQHMQSHSFSPEQAYSSSSIMINGAKVQTLVHHPAKKIIS